MVIYIYRYLYIHTHTHTHMSLAELVFCLIFLEMSNAESLHNWFFIWADEYTYLKNSFHFAKGENALLAIQNPGT